MGRRRRFLPRHGTPWRHLLPRLRSRLVESAGLHRAKRARHPRVQESHERRLGGRPWDFIGGTTRWNSARLLRGLHFPQARHRRVLALAHARLEEDQEAAILGCQLGRTGPASTRQFRRLRASGFTAEMARVPRQRTLDAFLYRLRRRIAEEVFWLLSQRRGHGLEQTAESAAAGTASRREVPRTARARMATRPHRMDQVLSRPGSVDDVDGSPDFRQLRHLCQVWLWGYIFDRTARTRSRDY